jgi:Fic/DOC family
MATRSEKLARSLEVLESLRAGGRTAIRSKELTRTHRERLLAAGFLVEVMKGWYICAPPDLAGGESTSWYVSYWSFCADYLNARLGENWCLSPEQSLLLHAGNHTIPRQLIVRSGRGTNNIVSLPHETTLLAVRSAVPKDSDQSILDGLRVYSIAAALVTVSPDFFRSHETVARAILARVTNASEILPPLLERGQTTIAGRLAGAFKNIKRARVSEDIMKAMRAAGHYVRISDPFSNEFSATQPPTPSLPHVNRLRLMWMEMREVVIDHFPAAPDRIMNVAEYMRSVEESYGTDAYHSLSIEGYQVSKELIERVRLKQWVPDGNEADRRVRDALAARGYWQAFQRVQGSLERVLNGENPGSVAERDHGDWYRELFASSVAAGIVKAVDLAGYRNSPVFIRQSRHVPPRSGAVRDLMPAFFELLAEEESAAVRVVLGHFVFVNIHPYMDGNGRIGRFLMNLMLAAGDYSWIVIPVDRRIEYMETLETASTTEDVVPFTRFLASLVAKQ